jgi:hypothetical protein
MRLDRVQPGDVIKASIKGRTGIWGEVTEIKDGTVYFRPLCPASNPAKGLRRAQTRPPEPPTPLHSPQTVLDRADQRPHRHLRDQLIAPQTPSTTDIFRWRSTDIFRWRLTLLRGDLRPTGESRSASGSGAGHAQARWTAAGMLVAERSSDGSSATGTSPSS